FLAARAVARVRVVLAVAFCIAVPASGAMAEDSRRSDSPSSDDVRSVLALNAGWRFKQATGLRGVETAQFDDSQWSEVTVPHTWNRIGNDGTERSPQSNNIQAVGWYRLRFTAPAAPKESRYFLQFDAVGTIADIWVNGHYLGKHEG